MRVLALDTSGLVVSAAVAEDGRLIAETFLHYQKTHSQTLLPLLADMLTRIGMDINDMDVLALAVGPGSFTGLRIGVCTVKGLSMPGGIPVAPVPTLDALAHTCALYEGLVCPVMDARRDQVYTALYHTGRGGIREKLNEDAALPVEALCGGLLEAKQPVLFCGDGADAYRDRISGIMGEYACFAPPALSLQRASSVAFLAEKMAGEGRLVSHGELAPHYIRQSQAEQRYGKG